MPQLNDEARRKLKELVRREGPTLGENEIRCRGLLNDHSPHLEIEINLITDAIKGNVPRRLLDVTGSLTFEMDKLTKLLRDKRGTAEENARWAVESWAFALGLIDANHAATRTAAPTVRVTAPPAIPPYLAADPAESPRPPAPPPPFVAPAVARPIERKLVALAKTLFALLCVGCLVAGAILLYLAQHSGGAPDGVATTVVSTPGVSTPAVSSPDVSMPAVTRRVPRPLTDPNTFTSPTLGTRFVRIKPGSFMMGSSESEEGREKNETQHRVRLTKPFYMAVSHVTRGDFRKFVEDDHYTTDAEKANDADSWRHNKHCEQDDTHPVLEVSWNDAIAFVDWLNRRENRGDGHRYRLPSEAEWEYACRAVDDPNGPWTPFNTGATLSTNLANYDGNSIYGAGVKGNYRGKTTPCGSFPANKFGLCDMHGNAWQWCYDVYAEYPTGAVTNPTGPAQEPVALHVLRGGSWGNPPVYCRSGCRLGRARNLFTAFVGFRVALDSP